MPSLPRLTPPPTVASTSAGRLALLGPLLLRALLRVGRQPLCAALRPHGERAPRAGGRGGLPCTGRPLSNAVLPTARSAPACADLHAGSDLCLHRPGAGLQEDVDRVRHRAGHAARRHLGLPHVRAGAAGAGGLPACQSQSLAAWGRAAAMCPLAHAHPTRPGSSLQARPAGGGQLHAAPPAGPSGGPAGRGRPRHLHAAAVEEEERWVVPGMGQGLGEVRHRAAHVVMRARACSPLIAATPSSQLIVVAPHTTFTQSS